MGHGPYVAVPILRKEVTIADLWGIGSKAGGRKQERLSQFADGNSMNFKDR